MGCEAWHSGLDGEMGDPEIPRFQTAGGPWHQGKISDVAPEALVGASRGPFYSIRLVT